MLAPDGRRRVSSAFVRFGWALGVVACGGTAPGEEAPRTLRAMTFNVGTTLGLAHDQPPDDGYTQAMAVQADALYNNSLSWNPAEDAVTAFLADTPVDIAAFQEIFWDGWCDDIDVDPALDFVCSRQDAALVQTQRVLGAGFQVACHLGKPDKCLGVHERLGRIAGCDGAFCLEGLRGSRVPDCGSGARVAAADIELVDGGVLTVVSVHGSSGLGAGDQACRAAQFRQVFEDGGDGAPLANGDVNLVLGDLNMDPYRFAGVDESADVWNAHVGEDRAFHHLTAVGPDAPPTYASGLASVDHIASDRLAGVGDCVVPGLTEGIPAVLEATYFDHKPVICEAAWP